MDASGYPGGTPPELRREGSGEEISGCCGPLALFPSEKKGALGAPLKSSRRDGEEGARTGCCGHFLQSSPASLQTCLALKGAAKGAPEVAAQSPTAPSPETRSRPQVLAHAGKPTDPVQMSSYSCLITFRVAPCLFLLCQKGREFQN